MGADGAAQSSSLARRLTMSSQRPGRFERDLCRLPTRRESVVQRVLVVEDSPVIQRLISVCLRPAGIEIEARADGPAGLEAAQTSAFDLLILDVGLPRMDGWQVLEQIRADSRTADLRVLVLTAHAQEETRERADRGGADAFITKPFRPDELRRVALDLMCAPRRVSA
jgi:CheY-like chemotaxis protein